MSSITKTPYAESMKTANHILEAIAPYCDRIEIAGSLRRQRPMIGDIEIVALPKRSTDLFGNPAPDRPTKLDSFLSSNVTLLKRGPKYKQFKYGRYMVDLFLPETPDHWGTVFLIRTGSHEFNMWLMTYQQKQARVKFSNGRLINWQHQLIDTPEEADVFKALGLPFVPVTMRDDNAWIQFIKQETSNA